MIPSRDSKAPLERASSPGTSGDTCPEALNQRIDLGRLDELELKILTQPRQCSLCYLIWESANDQLVLTGRSEFDEEPDDKSDDKSKDKHKDKPKDKPNNVVKRVSIRATWEIDGRESKDDKESHFFQPVTRRIRISFVKPITWLKPSYILLNGDDLKPPEFDPSFLGRAVRAAERSLEARIPLIAGTARAWLAHCDRRHEHCRPMPSIHLNGDPHLRVIDVQDNKLVPLRKSMKYVVLSYTWNEEPAETYLTLHRKRDWYAGGFLEDRPRLPPEIQNAMKLLQALGIRYLWVDSLCIIHDPGDKLKGKDKDEQMKDKRANYSDIDTILASAFLTICAVTGMTPVSQHIIPCKGKTSFMVHHPVETHIQNSRWFKGAWTCQDHMLSGRCLILTDSAVWFQCQEESMSEDIFEPSFKGRSADWVQSPAQIRRELAHESSRFRAYIQCVESYTPRELPSPTHALKAFVGISNHLGWKMETRFYSGLPSSHFDVAILWAPADPTARPREHAGQPVAPSWSWAGWTGQATYRPPMLTSSVESISEWLLLHTWISWYLVDQNSIIIGEIGTFAKEDIARVADGTPERRNKETGKRFTQKSRPPYQDDKERWPSRKRREFTKKLPVQPDLMEIDTGPVSSPNTLPYYLQFWTWSAFLRLGALNTDSGIRRYTILDRNDDICGSIVLPNRVVNDGQAFEFIATADARVFFEKDEMPEWTYYIPKERHDSSWDLWYVMLIRTDKDGISRREGVGKVFQDAFHQSLSPGMDWREFILA